MSRSKIEWCDETFNPVVGCQKISPGCKNCYAERMAIRLAKNPSIPEATRQAYRDVCKWDGTVRFIPGALEKIDKIKKPSRIFLGSMTDLALADWNTMDMIYKKICEHPQHIFMILTKRPRKLWIKQAGIPNLLLGITAENQEAFNDRIDMLKDFKRTYRYRVFLSCEPLLSPIDLGDAVDWLDWVIVGGETGAGKRDNEEAWFYSLSYQCEGRVPYFFKSFGNKENRLEYSGVTRREFPAQEGARDV